MLVNRTKNLFLLAILTFFIGYSGQSSAQNRTSDYRRIGEAEIQRFAEHTFWKSHRLDRVYFNSDGTFIQQLNDNWTSIENGTMYTGTWETTTGNLCWTYDSETAIKNSVPITPFCYKVMTNSPADNYMTTHGETFRLYPANQEGLGTLAFEWNQYAYDNYILDPEYLDVIQAGLNQMEEYRRNGNIPFGTTKRADLTDPWMQNYYDETVNRIFFIANQSMFFNDKGLFFYTNENNISKADGDVDKMIANGSKGHWTMKDNIHCWFLNKNRGSCEFVMPEGKGLIRPYEGIFGVFYTGFTRVHGEMATGHIDPSDTSSPALFNTLLEAPAHK